MADKLQPRSPIRWVEITISRTERSQFTDRMKRFAESFGFDIRISQSSPNPYDILIEMQRSDIDIIGANDAKADAPNMMFGIGFYQKRSAPPPPTPNVDVLVEGVKEFVSQIPRIIIRQTK